MGVQNWISYSLRRDVWAKLLQLQTSCVHKEDNVGKNVYQPSGQSNWPYFFLWLVELNRCLVPCSPAFKQTCLDGSEYLGFCLWLLEKAIEFFRRNSLVWIYFLFLMYDAYSLSVKSDMIEISLERKTNRWWTKHWKKMKMKPRYILTHPFKLLNLSFF